MKLIVAQNAFKGCIETVSAMYSYRHTHTHSLEGSVQKKCTKELKGRLSDYHYHKKKTFKKKATSNTALLLQKRIYVKKKKKTFKGNKK